MYSDILNKIRNNIKGNQILVSIDETRDVNGTYVANVVIGTLQTDQPGKVYLLNIEILDKVNYSINQCLFFGPTASVMITFFCLLVTQLHI
jgi:hypothetical protein